MPAEAVGILIPAYGAAGTVAGVVRTALSSCSRVLVVDDGSEDGSGDEAKAAGALVIRHRENRGKGAALHTGFRHYLGQEVEAIVTLDADGQHDAGEIPRFVSAWKRTGADVIVGARMEAFAGMSGARRFGNRFSSAAVRFFRGPSLPDTQSGFRLYSRAFLMRAPFRRRDYDAEIELLMRAGLDGCKVISIPIRAQDPDGRSTSHYRAWLDTYRMCRTVVIESLLDRRRGSARP